MRIYSVSREKGESEIWREGKPVGDWPLHRKRLYVNFIFVPSFDPRRVWVVPHLPMIFLIGELQLEYVRWAEGRMAVVVAYASGLVLGGMRPSFFTSCLTQVYTAASPIGKGALRWTLKSPFWVMVQTTVCGYSDTYNINSSRCGGD